MLTLVRRVEARLSAPLRVMAYHQVGDVTNDPWGIAVSPANFEAQVEVLVGAGRVLRLDESLADRPGRMPDRGRPRFAITFDDGYANNLHVALPILERLDAPATVFIASRYMDHPYFWWDRLADIVIGDSGDASTVVAAACEAGLIDDTTGDQLVGKAPETVIRQLYGAVLERSFEEQQDLLEMLGRRCAGTSEGNSSRPLTVEELQQLSEHPLITIGSHTGAHRRLTKISLEDAYRDVVYGDEQLDLLVGPRRRVFAYPNGDYDKHIVRMVKQAGFRCAFTTESRPISFLDNRLMLPRISTTDIGGPEFAAQRGISV